ncbi:MAG TPA: dTMP kinase [Nitrospiraceae bacterium]|jgi:dTMP kinase|nr:dTMP kinase [Nitrospiraceae bacterium]
MRRKNRQRTGVFITFEGIEGSGKSTQCAKLAKALRDQGTPVVETREPGGTPLAEKIRDLLLAPAQTPGNEPVSALCEAYLILAARSQHMAQVILPALADGVVVLCDRFSDSTLAYQGYARGLDRRRLQQFSLVASQGLMPDLTLLFDLPVERGLARRRGQSSDGLQGSEQNRIDRESSAFHNRVRKGFLDLARRNPRRIKVLDGSRDPDRLANEVLALVTKLLNKRPQKNVKRIS